jgi:hypothetical protein
VIVADLPGMLELIENVHVPAGAIATGVTTNEPLGPADVLAVAEPAIEATLPQPPPVPAVKTVLPVAGPWLTVTVWAPPAPIAVNVRVRF